MFGSGAIDEPKSSVPEAAADTGRLLSASIASATTPGRVGTSASAAPVIDPEAAVLKTNPGLAVNKNPLGRLRGHFAPVVPSSLTCSSASITGTAQDTCTVTLTSVASANLVVTLVSNNASVSVPSTVTIAKNASSGTFTATIAAVTSAATATVTAAANGGSTAARLQLNASIATLAASATTINFGNVPAGQTVTQSLVLIATGSAPVTISSISIVGSLFTAPGVVTPVTLNPGQSLPISVHFYSPQVSTFTGVMTIASNSSQGNIVVNMGAAGVASSGVRTIACAASSMTGSGSDACTVTLTSAAATGGVSVKLASNNGAVSVPASIVVPAAASSAAFTATVASVTTAQSATLTASANGTSATFSIQLSLAGQGKLSVNASSISFGNVALNDVATQSLTLSSTGTGAVIVSSATASGAGFSVSGASFPLTLNSGQTATLSVQFIPATTGALTGQLTISSNSATGATTTVSLSGTGQPHQVQLSWSGPAGSSDPISGFRIYRAAAGSSSYQLLNATLDKQTTFTDSTGLSGRTSYQYYVTSVDSAGLESVPSNTAIVNLP